MSIDESVLDLYGKNKLQSYGAAENATAPDLQKNDLQDDWEFELDLLGTSASIESLEEHLGRAPDPKSATAHFLRGFIANHVQFTR